MRPWPTRYQYLFFTRSVRGLDAEAAKCFEPTYLAVIPCTPAPKRAVQVAMLTLVRCTWVQTATMAPLA